MVHLTNYLPRPVEKVLVTVCAPCQKVSLFTPDAQRDPPQMIRSGGNVTQMEVPRVKIYTLLAIDLEQ